MGAVEDAISIIERVRKHLAMHPNISEQDRNFLCGELQGAIDILNKPRQNDEGLEPPKSH